MLPALITSHIYQILSMFYNKVKTPEYRIEQTNPRNENKEYFIITCEFRIACWGLKQRQVIHQLSGFLPTTPGWFDFDSKFR